MTSDRALKKIEPEIDGFEGYEDGVEGNDEQRGGIIRGMLLKFTNDFVWVTGDGEELSAGLELVAVDIVRVVQKWVDKMPVETRILGPGKKFPDIDKLNDTPPRGEWTEGPNGQPKGPWQAQHIVYLLNLETMDRYSYPTGTTGGGIAVKELVDRTNWMRRFRGDGAFPVVKLTKKYMNTRYGGRDRPFFLIAKWVSLGGDAAIEAAPVQPAIEHTSKPVVELKPAAKPRTISEPTLNEILDDALPDFGKK